MAGCAVDPEAWPGMDDPQAAVHMRLLASRALAELCDKLTGQVRMLSMGGGKGKCCVLRLQLLLASPWPVV